MSNSENYPDAILIATAPTIRGEDIKPLLGYECHIPRAALRIGPYLSQSRKRRRHRLRQWHNKQRQDREATVIDNMEVKHDPATGLDFMITKTHDRRTGQKREHVEITATSFHYSATPQAQIILKSTAAPSALSRILSS